MDIETESSSKKEGGAKKRSRSLLEAQAQAQAQLVQNGSTTTSNTITTDINQQMKMDLTNNDNNVEQDPHDNDENNINNHQPPAIRQRILNEQNIQRMRLEAIFHPKFENEKQHNDQQQIRQTMIENVSKGEGVLEVSLKHSGSLVLWSGGNRYYSKNATDNVHTHVAEVLLRQHFARAWSDSENGNGNSNADDDTISDDIRFEKKYKECSEYIQSQRLTLSFEVVTSVLGHHGDLPNRDFLILIAVADRTKGTFYTTTQIMKMAQNFRLPHNDVWIFQSMESATALFDLYDTSREDGLADDVIDTLSHAADGGHVKSLYPHGVFQGQILEGIVIRFVRIQSDVEKESISELCLQSDSILKAVPPEKYLNISSSLRSSSNDIDIDIDIDINDKVAGPIRLLKTNLKELFDQNNDNNAFASSLKDIIKESSHTNDNEHENKNENNYTRNTSKLNKKEINVPSIAAKLLEDDKIDSETRNICTLIQKMESLKLSVNYHVILEQNESNDGSSSTTTRRYLCIIHILHDFCHQKYHVATRTSGGMALYRGFSIELLTKDDMVATVKGDTSRDLNNKMGKVRLESSSSISNSIISDHAHNADDGKLMLKMKFLPYMVRTFICRNGMAILNRKGSVAFDQYAFDQLKKWGMSNAAVDKWIGFFHAWGTYCESPSQKTTNGTPLPTLSSANYLHHLYHFESLYANGFFNSKKKKHDSSFYGLVVVVGVNKDEMTEFAVDLSSTLGCSRTLTDVNALTEADMARTVQNEGGGMVCAATITDGAGQIRLLGKNYKDNMYIVMVGCSRDEIEATFVKNGNPNTKELKKTIGMTNAWRKSRVPFCKEISHSCISDGLQFDNNEELSSMIQKLKDASKYNVPDNKAGMLVFFPSIPGCGKSSMCNNLTSISPKIEGDRKLFVREGDKTKAKFWPLALNHKLKEPSSVYVADKNVPPASWHAIDSICSKTRGIAVCVVPDSSALENTTISIDFLDQNDGMKLPVRHNFPFSLHFLALCMSRVLRREPNSHNGKLDSATDTACMIVVKFYCLYRGHTVSSFRQRMSTLGRGENKTITVPFFKEGELPEMPTDLKQILEGAIGLQTQRDLKLEESSDFLTMEQELRTTLATHRKFLESLPAAEEYSRESFVNQLRTNISFLSDTFEERGKVIDSNEYRTIRIVSLDFDRQQVNSILDKIVNKNPTLDLYLKEKGFEKARDIITDDSDKKQDRFIQKTHCTFAHAQRTSQEEMKKIFDHLIGNSCEVNVNAILFDYDVAALEISVPSFVEEPTRTIIPASVNEFTHITIFCSKGISAFQSNNLPSKVTPHGVAKRIELESPIPIKGKFSYWYED